MTRVTQQQLPTWYVLQPAFVYVTLLPEQLSSASTFLVLPALLAEWYKTWAL